MVGMVVGMVGVIVGVAVGVAVGFSVTNIASLLSMIESFEYQNV